MIVALSLTVSGCTKRTDSSYPTGSTEIESRNEQEYNNTEEKYSQGRRMMDYMNLTDTLSQEQKKQVKYFVVKDLITSWKNYVY